MTPKISLVAVCCSKDSFNSLNNRTFSMCDHSLIGEGFKKLDLRRGERAYLDPTRDQCSDKFPLLTKRND